MSTVATSQLAHRFVLRTPPAALHVHVGMPDPETAIRASNGLRRLEGVNQILIEGNGADLQGSIYARGGMPELLSWLTGERHPPTGSAASRRGVAGSRIIGSIAVVDAVIAVPRRRLAPVAAQ